MRPFAARVVFLLLVLLGCTSAAPCPKGATQSRVPDPELKGAVAVVCRSADGALDGPVTLTWDGKQPRLTGQFDKGQQVGSWTWWHPNGKKRASYGFSPGRDGSVPAGTWETWHPNGKPQWQVSFKDGVPHGPARELRDDGTRRFEGAFTAGRRSGTWTAWYRAGGKAGEGQYEDDRPAGRWAVWWKSGAAAGARAGRDGWKYQAPDGGALTEDEYDARLHPRAAAVADALAGGPLGGFTVGEAQPISDGPPAYVPPLTVPKASPQDPYFPWAHLADIWFYEFRDELRLRAEDLE